MSKARSAAKARTTTPNPTPIAGVELETSTPDIETNDTDVEYTVPPVEPPPSNDHIAIKGKLVNDGLTTEQKITRRARRPITDKSRNKVAAPAGRIIKEGEPVRIEADELNFAYVVVRENVYQERFVFGSNRPSYFLLYRAGQKVAKSALQHLG